MGQGVDLDDSQHNHTCSHHRKVQDSAERNKPAAGGGLVHIHPSDLDPARELVEEGRVGEDLVEGRRCYLPQERSRAPGAAQGHLEVGSRLLSSAKVRSWTFLGPKNVRRSAGHTCRGDLEWREESLHQKPSVVERGEKEVAIVRLPLPGVGDIDTRSAGRAALEVPCSDGLLPCYAHERPKSHQVQSPEMTIHATAGFRSNVWPPAQQTVPVTVSSRGEQAIECDKAGDSRES